MQETLRRVLFQGTDDRSSIMHVKKCLKTIVITKFKKVLYLLGSKRTVLPFLNAFRVVFKNTRNKDVYKSCKKNMPFSNKNSTGK